MALSGPDAAHLLRRTGFGGLPNEVAAFTGVTREAAVDAVTDLSKASVRPYHQALLSAVGEYAAFNEALYWWFDSMVGATLPLQEKMVLFWHDHFVSSQDKVGVMAAMLQQNQVFRAHGLRSFRDLCREVAVGPAMLAYLDNASNVKGNPQENFGRELMELHTLGAGMHSEVDVVEMARAWTGHGLADPRTYAFFPERHDYGQKTIFGVTRAWDGPETIDEIVLGSRQQDCARFIARKLYRAFVHPKPTAGVIEDLAGAFVSSGMDIRALVRAILLHDDFWSASARYALVKSPVEYMVEILRRTGVSPGAAGIHFTSQATGQLLFCPPGVNGWGENEPWLSVQSVWGKAGFAGYVSGSTAARGWWAGMKDLSPSEAVSMMCRDFGMLDVSVSTRSFLESWFRRAVAEIPWAVHMQAVVMASLVPEFQLK